MAKSQYRDGESDYAHRFHAGNLGDVLKHAVLLAWVKALQADERPLHIVDTHAGSGMYPLPPKGEWEAGIGRLDALGHETAPGLVGDYLKAVGDRRVPNRGGLYPGSPALLRGLIRADDRLSLVELADGAHAKLAEFYATDARVEVHGGDGFAFVQGLEAQERLAVFIDPPYSQKLEWNTVANTVRAVREVSPEAAICVWYPIKSLMRPKVLAEAVRDLGPGATIDLISTPLKTADKNHRKGLNGSGLLLIDPPAGLLADVGAVLPWLGATLAHPSQTEWTASTRGWA